MRWTRPLRERINALLPPGSFIRNVGLLTSGTLVAQFITVLTLPILTRFYTPEDFSMLAVYVSIINIIAAVASLRYNIAIPIPEKDADGFALLAASLISSFLICILIALLIYFNSKTILQIIREPQIEPYLWAIPLGAFFAASYDSLQYWASRMKRFDLITRTRMTRATGAAGTQLGVGFSSASPFGLVAGQMVYSALGIFGLFASLIRNDRTAWQDLSLRRVSDQARRNYRFPVYSAPESLLNAASVELPIILIAAFAAGPEAGFLMLAMRIMGMPMALIGSSVAQVFLADARMKQSEGSFASVSRSTMWDLFRFGAPPLLACGLLSPIIFPILFGHEWSRAGWLVLWMTPWFILQFIVSPVSIALHVLGKQVVATMLQGVGLVLRVGVILVAANLQPDISSEAYAISGALFYFIYLVTVINVIGAKS